MKTIEAKADIAILDRRPDPNNPERTVVFAIFGDKQAADSHMRKLKKTSKYPWRIAYCIGGSVPVEDAAKAEADLIPGRD